MITAPKTHKESVQAFNMGKGLVTVHTQKSGERHVTVAFGAAVTMDEFAEFANDCHELLKVLGHKASSASAEDAG
jgi:hypothetical protein